MHQRLGRWCRYYDCLAREGKSNSDTRRFMGRLNASLKELIGDVNFQSLDIGYHHKQAMNHFYHAIEMHRGGAAYRSVMGQMYYLDDDFDDKLYHFCAAIERYRIGSGYIRSRIKSIKEQFKEIDDFWYAEVLGGTEGR